ncbi:jmjC domain-containing protein A-like isoform X2 [Glandiceps talaboti]
MFISKFVVTTAIFLALNIHLCVIGNTSSSHPKGHLQPLGSHQPAEGHVEVLEVIPSPKQFYENYVKASKPVIFKGAAKMSPGFNLWSDDYLRSQYGDVIVRVDYGKKENRERSADPMPLAEFLDLYNSSDRYLVDTLPDQLWKEYNLLPCITCGGFTKGLQDAVLWFSSGGTKSFLHMDTVENINCMMSGTKEWFFVDIRDSHHVELDHKEGDYSSVDVDHVDMYAYPGLQHVPWWSAHLDTGDCMYVPYGWIHQVTSISRNIAVNIWWTPDLEFNDSDCQVAMETGPGVSLDDFQFTPAEQFRFMIIKLIENNGGQVDFKEVQKLLISEHTGTPLMDEEVFSKFDMDGDNYLTVSDLKIVPVKTFHEELEEFETGNISPIRRH